ncbi:MAG TPA: DUF1003 domain-containing protein [Patescibacteria group bacterium]|nr:DUF1003 domain-containing protein [Patescibacteria group bacterium]
MKTALKTYHQRLEEYRQAKLKKTERAADLIAKWCGSWSFLIIHIIGFILWLAFNLNFNFLTLIVSFEAILLMNILLMAQNRQSKKDELRDEADYQADKHSADKMDELIELLKKAK